MQGVIGSRSTAMALVESRPLVRGRCVGNCIAFRREIKVLFRDRVDMIRSMGIARFAIDNDCMSTITVRLLR